MRGVVWSGIAEVWVEGGFGVWVVLSRGAVVGGTNWSGDRAENNDRGDKGLTQRPSGQ